MLRITLEMLILLIHHERLSCAFLPLPQPPHHKVSTVSGLEFSPILTIQPQLRVTAGVKINVHRVKREDMYVSKGGSVYLINAKHE